MEYILLILITAFILRLMYKKEGAIKLLIPTTIITISSIYLFEDIRIAMGLIVMMLAIAFITRKILAQDMEPVA